MSFPEQSIEAIFANKKDKNYVKVLSHYSYLESFVLSDVKSVGLRIPETILIEHGFINSISDSVLNFFRWQS